MFILPRQGYPVEMPRRVDGGQALAAIGAVILIISLFLEWFGPEVTAWTVFEIVDLLLAAIALATLVAIAPPSLWGQRSAPPVRHSWLLALGVAALVLVAAALINHPPAAVGRPIESGAWLGLAAAALMAVGGLLAGKRISVVVGAADSGVSPQREAHARPAEPDPRPTQPAPYEDPEARTRRLSADDPR